MIAKVNKIPIFLLERLKWELGLPQDYEMSVVPEFPDYFRVIDGGRLGENWKMLELVCWSDEFSVSEMEH
ncbi:protein ROOT PRIMORDIUM DEFECTIVE 1-like [Dorcoceras hygrometricum]|uniref:Protein ROOT PRIMORDIUM DEFECTIVE 1-like n=1 Tax=Dorcoceras hygrometricum TaxID=472368 RepID=A0A2Z7ABJ4_9LAMI|nr:protein ROOT PRIMORDIUM DEFECTIVE 1-like [Dorcoceras hygrometricum]